MDKIDLNELERVAADYDKRKEAARTFEIENFGSTTEERARYLAALKYGEATKAFEALRPLIARVRELERQRELLARNLAETPWCLACQIKICSNGGKNIDPLLVDRNECKNVLIRWAEQAAKEAGE